MSAENLMISITVVKGDFGSSPQREAARKHTTSETSGARVVFNSESFFDDQSSFFQSSFLDDQSSFFQSDQSSFFAPQSSFLAPQSSFFPQEDPPEEPPFATSCSAWGGSWPAFSLAEGRLGGERRRKGKKYRNRRRKAEGVGGKMREWRMERIPREGLEGRRRKESAAPQGEEGGQGPRRNTGLIKASRRTRARRGWRNTVEIVILFEISNSMKPYPCVFHAYTTKLRPVIGFFDRKHIDEASNHIPPTSQTRSLT